MVTSTDIESRNSPTRVTWCTSGCDDNLWLAARQRMHTCLLVSGIIL